MAWPASGDWSAWAATWEARMQAFFPHRQQSIEAILTVLVELLPAGRWRILDLGAGTGTLSRALLHRFPTAHVTALDLDPVLMTIGRGALGDGAAERAGHDTARRHATPDPQAAGAHHPHLTWVQADLRSPDWPARLGDSPSFDAVVSLATLHHFSPREVGAIYGQLARLIRPGGLLLNAEGLAAGPPSSRLARCFDEARRRGSPPPDGWWEAVAADPAFKDAVSEREALRDRMRGAGSNSSAEAHCRALRRAGFAEAAVAWRYLDEALVVGLR
ncbi:MAG: class I SAM-dependent methyltransferase [Chloroflexota bacterium]